MNNRLSNALRHKIKQVTSKIMKMTMLRTLLMKKILNYGVTSMTGIGTSFYSI
jgi:hypothetical protein